ncbi:hypothetical protein BVC80_8987g23 [Macleaya cordata]|uniref:AT hook n=1 Tax=Macleaya cordata TaxID=56857 RepID=A0A200QJ78_MACCD|nr:hypothetical protein BVC80_8987g23 [Macleaya cordata]
MNQENQGSNSAAPENLPVKRKRGRPRKDERPVQGAKASSTPGPDTVKRNRQRTNPAPTIGNAMVGQVVSGVLDGKFEAGYLLTVRVGDTNTIMRGVVFEPGKSVPISGANDVAPHINMLRRNDITLPVVDSPVPMHGSIPQSEQKQPTQVLQGNENSLPPKVSQPVNQVPKVATQVLPSQLQTKPVASSEVQNDTSHAPQAATPLALQQAEIKAQTSDITPRSQATEPVIEKKKPTDVVTEDKVGLPPKVDVSHNDQHPIITPQQAAECELKKEPASATQTSPSEHNRTVEPDVVLLDNEALSISEGPRDVRDASKDSRVEPETEPSVELPSKTIGDQVSQGGSEAVGSELKSDMQIDDASKSLEPELNLNTAIFGSEQKPDMQIDEASKSLESELNLNTATDGSEHKPDMQIDAASKRLEPVLNLNTATDGSEFGPDMQIDDASKSLEPELNLNTATDGSELKPDMQIDNATKSLEPELNLNTTYGSELKHDQQTVGELKDKAVEINCTLVANAPEAKASQLSTGPITLSPEDGTLQKSDQLQDTESKVPMEFVRTDEVTKSEPQLEPSTDQQVGVLQREEAIPGAQNGSDEEDLAEPNVLSKDAPESKTFDVNVPTEGEDAVSKDAASLVQTKSSMSESNNDTDSIGGTEKVDMN